MNIIIHKNKEKDFIYLACTYLFSVSIWMLIFNRHQFESMYYCILNISSLISISSIISCIISFDNDEKHFYKYIALTFAFVGILQIIFVGVDMFKLYGENTINKSIQIVLFLNLFEILSLFISFKYLNEKFNQDKFLAFRLILISTACIFILKFNIIPNMYDADNGGNTIYNIVRVLLVSAYIIFILTLKKYEQEIYSDTSKYLKSYILMKIFIIAITATIEYINKYYFKIENDIVFLIISILKFLTSYYILKISVIYGIKMPNIKLYEELLKQKDILNRRNDVLLDISHEFKTPLNVIYSSIQMQELNITNKNIDNMIKFNNIAKQNCDSLIKLTNNFINYTKFTNQNFKTNLQCINMVEVIEELTMSVVPFAENKNIEVIFDTSSEEIYSLIDMNYIERIIINLLSNAVKYNKDNGKITVYVNEDSENVITTIKDTGIGIPKDKLENIFNRFERARIKNSSGNIEGLGIGLNLVKKLVNSLEGTINIDSGENQGTTVTLIFKKVTDYHDYKCDYRETDGNSIDLSIGSI